MAMVRLFGIIQVVMHRVDYNCVFVGLRSQRSHRLIATVETATRNPSGSHNAFYVHKKWNTQDLQRSIV